MRYKGPYTIGLKEEHRNRQIGGFLSYSHQDRVLAGCVKDALGSYGISLFLAHEDLQPSQEWQDEICRQLNHCEAFFLLLTDSFKDSDWTDQETGIAVALNKIIVPLKVTLNPYGFVARYQAQSLQAADVGGALDLSNIDEVCWNVVRTLSLRSDIGDRIKDSVIEKFAQSAAFREAAHYSSRLQDLEPFHSEQVQEIVRVSCRNGQIYGCFAARDYIRELIRKYDSCLPRGVFRRFLQLSKAPVRQLTASLAPASADAPPAGGSL
jgi:hypothetical protein